MLTILFLGDIVGEPGRSAVIARLPELKRRHEVDFIIVNGENAAAGAGLRRRSRSICCAQAPPSSRLVTTCGTRRS
jgi:calcineurin-like phosphoesterase